MILTLLQGHRCVRNINCKLCVLDPCPVYFKLCLVATYIKRIMHNKICVTDLYSRKIINRIFFSKVSGLVESFNIWIYSDTLKVINVKLYMMVLFIELYLFMAFFLFIVFSVTLPLTKVTECQTVLTESFVFLSS